MMLRCMVGVVAAVLFLDVCAYAQNATPWKMRLTLGTPPEFEVDLQYFEPSTLYRLASDSLVVPIWVSARNISGRPATLRYDDFTLRLGDANALVTLDSIPPSSAESEIKNAVRLGPVLRAITGQGGEWAANPMNSIFRGDSVSPGRKAEGWVFFLRPPNLAFTGVMEFGTRRHAPDLLTTSTVNVVNTRAGSSLQERVIDAINDAIKVGQEILYGRRPFGRSYAILFGVWEYRFRKELKGPSRDLENMSAALKAQGFDKVITLPNKAVTADAMRNIQQHFKDGDALQPDDRLLVYYAGHGDRDSAGDIGYLVLADSNPTAPPGKNEVSMTDFMAWMKGLPVKHLLVILDACFSGLAIGGYTRADAPPLDAANRQALFELSARSGRFVMTAGDENQLANEHQRWGGGLFTQGILRALKTRDTRADDRLVTTFELFARTKDFVNQQVRAYGLAPQSPLLQDLGEAPQPDGTGGDRPSPVSRGEFVFVNVN